MILLVSGVAGSGKTTIWRQLAIVDAIRGGQAVSRTGLRGTLSSLRRGDRGEGEGQKEVSIFSFRTG